MTRKFRLAVVNSHPIQYFAPLYAYVSRDPEIEVTVLYGSDFSLRGGMDPGFKQAVTWDVDLLSGYKSVFLKGADKRDPAGFWSLICPDLWKEITTGQYDAVVLHGYAYAMNLVAFAAAKASGIPVFMRSETHAHGETWRHKARDAALSIGYRFVDGFLAIGTANRRYYRSLRVPEQKIFDVPYTVDNDRFIAAASLSPAERAALRSKHGLPLDKPVVLYASKLMRRKHPDDLVHAVARLQARGIDVALFMVGTGEMLKELKELAAKLGVSQAVFGGFVNQAELPKLFAASDVFVLPSEREPWGLVVNEAMCAGVPVIVSDEVGCVADLVKDGVNGYHMKAGDIESLAAALEKVLADRAARERMGAASLSIIKEWSYAKCHQGIAAALQQRAM